VDSGKDSANLQALNNCYRRRKGLSKRRALVVVVVDIDLAVVVVVLLLLLWTMFSCGTIKVTCSF
jgi:hypothetical protein